MKKITKILAALAVAFAALSAMSCSDDTSPSHPGGGIKTTVLLIQGGMKTPA